MDGAARAAREVGVPATIFVPQDAPMAKVEATRRYGARVELGLHGFELRVSPAKLCDRGGQLLLTAGEFGRRGVELLPSVVDFLLAFLGGIGLGGIGGLFLRLGRLAIAALRKGRRGKDT